MLNFTTRSFRIYALTTTFLLASGGFAATSGTSDGTVVDKPDAFLTGAGQSSSNDKQVFIDPQERFVARLYKDLLRHPVEPAALKIWTDRLAKGMSRSEVVRGIRSSTEYHTLVVRDLYSTLLGRELDAQKLKDAVAFLQSGGALDKIRAGILGSAEYFANADRDNSAFLDGVYSDVLHRPVDPTGRETWTRALNSGVARAQVALGVLQSAEARQRLVEKYYDTFLNRAVEKAESDAWLKKMQTGQSELLILDAILSSQEYFVLAQRDS